VSVAILILAIVFVVAVLLPFYRVVIGPTVFDRMMGVGVIGTKTVVLVCLVGFAYQRLDMFIDIAISYAMLNYIGTVVVAKYLDSSGARER
jgi:multicomponent Na+:H+ antiporter subunit F